MIKRNNQRSINEIMNEVLKVVRDYYDSEYAYYIEKTEIDFIQFFEWTADGIPAMKDKFMFAEKEQPPKWIKEEILDTTSNDYSVFLDLGEGVTAILAVVGVHRGGCEIDLMKALLPQISNTIVSQKDLKLQEFLMYHDNLTGLLNRNSFVSYLAEVVEDNLKSVGALSVDINGLKNFNKEFGRDYGDEVVKRVGEVLETYFKGSFAFRLTGDEYLVIAENKSYEEFMRCVHESHDYLENISQGLTTIGYSWEKINIDVGNVVNNAESMMHEEKKKYYKNLTRKRHQPIIKKDLLDDIEQGRFIVCLVPKFDVRTNQVTGAETVVKYHHKDMGAVDPGRYITMLEETKLSAYLDLFVFEQVCKALRKWEQQGYNLIPIAVNFAETTLRQENIVKKMMAFIEQNHVSCEFLEVEVTESGSDMNQEMLSETCNKMRRANIRVILDHFGAKNSSFTILSIMDFDGLKLDASLMTGIVRSHRSQTVAKALIDICHNLGSSICADGIETQDQLNVLEELGCDYAQGTLFNKPITIDTFEKRYLSDSGF